MFKKKEEKIVLDFFESKEKEQVCSDALYSKIIEKTTLKTEKKNISRFSLRFAYMLSSFFLVSLLTLGVIYYANNNQYNDNPHDNPPIETPPPIHFGDDDLENKTIEKNEIAGYYNKNYVINYFDIDRINYFYYVNEDNSSSPIYLSIEYKSNVLMDEENFLPETIKIVIILNNNYDFTKASDYITVCDKQIETAEGFYQEIYNEEEFKVTTKAYFEFENMSYYIDAVYFNMDIQTFMETGMPNENPPNGERIEEIVNQFCLDIT